VGQKAWGKRLSLTADKGTVKEQTMRLAYQTITIYPLRAEHFSFLHDVSATLAATLDVEVVSVSRTRVLHEALICVSGKEVPAFVSQLQDCFLDAEVSLEPGASDAATPGKPAISSSAKAQAKA
jgi:hypothetical protein